MIYFNMHTHRQEIRQDEIAIVSVNVRKPFELCKSIPIFYSIGVHPWYIDSNDYEATNKLLDIARQFAHNPEIVAIGETGLDKTTAKSVNDFSFQREFFIAHARLSEEVKKPLIIHCVKAWNDLLHFHQSIKPSMPWIIHGFRGKTTLANQLLNAGFYLSFSIHYNIDSLKAAWVKHRLFVETDDKDVDIRDVYQQVANDLAVSIQDLSEEIQVLRLQMLK